MSQQATETLPDSSVRSAEKQNTSRRLTSLDALRGFDMFWIVGGEELVHGLYRALPNPLTRLLETQMDHVAWRGFHFYDLIFPTFVFVVGTSMAFSLTRIIAESGKAGAFRRIFVRSLILYIFGLLVYGGISKGFDQIRWMGVLQRIAIAYFFTGSLFVLFRPKALVGICAGLLLGYWAVTALVPIRNFNLETTHLGELGLKPAEPETRQKFLATTDIVRGKYDDGLSVPQHIDFLYLPGHRWDGAYDPEGLLSNFPAIATCLLGLFAGLLLKNGAVPDQKKVAWLLAAGVAAVALGWTWNLSFPVIKKIWSSSYVLVAGGYSCLLLAAFYQVIEIWGVKKWSTPFIWIGMNPINIYLAFHLIDFRKFADLVAGGPVKQAVSPFGELLIACVVVALMLAFVRFLYQRKIFLRL